jgi:hypothetical protein
MHGCKLCGVANRQKNGPPHATRGATRRPVFTTHTAGQPMRYGTTKVAYAAAPCDELVRYANARYVPLALGVQCAT